MEKNCNTFERKRTEPRNSWLGRSASPGRLCPNGSRALPHRILSMWCGSASCLAYPPMPCCWTMPSSSLCCQSGQLPAALGTADRRTGSRAGLHWAADPGDCASVFPSVHVETKPDQNWIRVYTGLSGFLLTKNLGWLFCLLCCLLAGGIAALFHPQLQRVWKKLRQRFARKGTPFAEE